MAGFWLRDVAERGMTGFDICWPMPDFASIPPPPTPQQIDGFIAIRAK